MAALELWQRHEAGAQHKEPQCFRAPGKAAHKKPTGFLPSRDSQAGTPSLTLWSYCCHREEAVAGSGCGSRSPRFGCPNPSPLLPLLATTAFGVVSGPTSFPRAVVASDGPEAHHALL